MSKLNVQTVNNLLRSSGVPYGDFPGSRRVRGRGHHADGWTVAQRGQGVRVWVYGPDERRHQCADHLRRRGLLVRDEGRALFVTCPKYLRSVEEKAA